MNHAVYGGFFKEFEHRFYIDSCRLKEYFPDRLAVEVFREVRYEFPYEREAV